MVVILFPRIGPLARKILRKLKGGIIEIHEHKITPRIEMALARMTDALILKKIKSVTRRGITFFRYRITPKGKKLLAKKIIKVVKRVKKRKSFYSL